MNKTFALIFGRTPLFRGSLMTKTTRLTANVVILMLLSAGTLIAGPREPSSPPQKEKVPQSASGKPPWLWTTEERIAKRVDPAEREARRARSLQTGGHVAAGWTPIDGSVDPELFLPVELVTRLVLNTKAPNERMREVYRVAIASHAWNYEQFWGVLNSAAAPYLSLMEQSGVLQRETRGHADLSQLAPQICAASFDLLDTAYKTFGQQNFDAFLYSNVAPPIRTSIADYADTADALRKKDRGCR